LTTKPRTQAVITIAMDNDAFAYSPATELSRILVTLAGEVATDGISYTALRDINGNTVGYFRIDSEVTQAPSMPHPHILNVLDISTAHLTLETMRLLDTTPQDDWPVSGADIPFGYFVHAADENDGSIPADLWDCIELARLHGCSHLRFDRDADPHPSLKNYHD
jgi:hypothetical protein